MNIVRRHTNSSFKSYATTLDSYSRCLESMLIAESIRNNLEPREEYIYAIREELQRIHGFSFVSPPASQSEIVESQC